MANLTTYVARSQFASPAASTTSPHLQLLAPASATAGASTSFEVLRLEITQETSTTSGAMAVEIVRSTATAAGTLTSTGAVNALLNGRDSNPLSALTNGGFSGVGAGTQTVLWRAGFNILNGYAFIPTPQEYWTWASGQALWVRFPLVVAATFNVNLIYDELG